MQEPLISIIMPAYNASKTIKAAIHSILNQNYDNFELIIIDDGSTDNTFDIISSFTDNRITAIKNSSNIKMAKSRNIGIEQARGDYIAFCDSDDLVMPEKLPMQLNFLINHPDIDIVGCNMYVIKDDGEIIGSLKRPLIHEELVSKMFSKAPLFNATVMGKAEWFKRNKYNESCKRAEDRELWFRTFNKSRFANIPDCLYVYLDAGWPTLNKLFYANWYDMLIRFKYWREYNLPIHWVYLSPMYVSIKIIYYLIGHIISTNRMWSHLKPVSSSINMLNDQIYIYNSIKSGIIK